MILNQVSVAQGSTTKEVFLVKTLNSDTFMLGGLLPLFNRRCATTVVYPLPFFSREFSSFKQQKRSNLDSLLDSFPSLSGNLHLYTTTNIKECSQVLLIMYNSLIDPVVKLYITNNCLHLISLDGYTKEITKGDFIDYQVDGQNKQGHPSLYTGESGCYAFLCLKTGDYYVGSAVCLNTRYKAHKVNSSRPERGGSNSLYLSVRKHG